MSSTQDVGGTPFGIATNHENLRLLELPTSLLELIKSDNPPDLKLKSTAVIDDGSQQPRPYAVLCTDHKTFQVRQVQTSNSVFVMNPIATQLPSSSGVDTPSVNLRTLARCPSLLELIPYTPPVVAFLRQNVPVYDGEETDGDPSETVEPWSEGSKHRILEDAPFSGTEFDKGWQELCAFEHGSASWIPTPKVLVHVWGCIATAASVQGPKLEGSLSISATTSMAEEQDCPAGLVLAVLERLTGGGIDLSGSHATLDHGKCVPWLGGILLESLGSETLVTSFISQWQDKLPEAWRAFASLETIEGMYCQPTKATLRLGSAGDSVALPKAATAKPRPNWHEKFKNARR